jgi:hypothetical protein
MYDHKPYYMLIKNTRSESTRIESLAGIEIESKEVSVSK